MFHKIILVGNLGKDPEMRYTPGGQPVTSFSVASNRRYTDSGGQMVEETIWFRISVWGKQAEACKQYLVKGRQVLVEGRLVCDRPAGRGPTSARTTRWARPSKSTPKRCASWVSEKVRLMGKQRAQRVDIPVLKKKSPSKLKRN
jgi:primosomal replication protein N